MTVLGTIIARLVGIVRGFAMAEIVAQVIIWRSFYLASPWLLWGPAAALAWGGATIAYLRRGRPGRSLVCADAAVYTMLAFGAAWCVPAAIRGEAASWLFIVVVTQSVAPVWFAPRALAIPLAVMPGIALAAGTAASAPALVAAGPRRASLVLVFVVAAMHWLVQRTLRARAVAADAGLAAAHREARDHCVVLSENFERREQDRLLHDTILNTLTAIAGSGGTTAAISQCRQDIALLERALSESGDAGRTGPVAAIETVAREMRARGLAVDVEITGGAAAAGTPEPGLVPGPVVAAVAHATREALANVAAHAGTGRAWVTVSVMPPGQRERVPGDPGDRPGRGHRVRPRRYGPSPARGAAVHHRAGRGLGRLGMLAVAAWVVPRARAGGLSRLHAGAAITVAVAAVTAIDLDRRMAGTAMNVDWTILGVIWLLALLALTSPAWVWVPGSALVTGIHVAFVLRELGFSPFGLTRVAASSYAAMSVLAVFAALRPALRTHAAMAVRRAALASRSAAERAAVAAIGEVRCGRLALLEMEALPLLRGIADGILDPDDRAVRDRCAAHAATLRRALADRAGSVLAAHLELVCLAARARGVLVEVQAIGDSGGAAGDVALATVGAVDLVLRALPPQQVILTVLVSGDAAELYLPFCQPPAGCDLAALGLDVAGLGRGVPAASAWRAALEAGDPGPGCLEVRWRTAAPP